MAAGDLEELRCEWPFTFWIRASQRVTIVGRLWAMHCTILVAFWKVRPAATSKAFDIMFKFRAQTSFVNLWNIGKDSREVWDRNEKLASDSFSSQLAPAGSIIVRLILRGSKCPSTLVFYQRNFFRRRQLSLCMWNQAKHVKQLEKKHAVLIMRTIQMQKSIAYVHDGLLRISHRA